MTPDAEKANILVVDDLPENALVYRAVLEQLGENVVTVPSGAEALKQLLQHSFAVILLDVNMPDMDGFETARLIRRHKRAGATPIIFLTAFADEVRTAEGYATGAVDYLPTPVVPEILRAKVRVFVELFKMRREVALQAEERARHVAAEETNRRLTFSADSSAVLGRSLDFDATAHDVVRLPVPMLADAAVLSCEPRAGGSKSVLQARIGLNGGLNLKQMLDDEPLPDGVRDAIHRATVDGKSVFWPGPVARGPDVWPSLVAIPLVARDHTIAVLALFREPTRAGFNPNDIAMASAFASRAATALDNAILHEELLKADRQKNDFLSMLSHELRNPLAPICNAVELLRMHAPDDPNLQWASEVVDRQVTQMVRLVDDLLDISRITCGKIRLQRRPVELDSVVSHAVEASRPLIEARRHRLSVVLPERTVWVDGDPARLAQVLTNLLNNAAKYTEDGGQISLTAREEDDTAIVTVCDNGIGIPSDMLTSVFELFTQVDRTLDRSAGGLGIGLTLVQRLVEMHGGTVSAYSAGSGRGSEFTVSLPVLTPQVPSESGESKPRWREALPMKVLVVDDNPDSADTLATLLRLAGHEVQVAYDGPSGLTSAQTFEPAVVLLDIGLPGMDGYAVAARLRESEATRNTLLIAISGYGQEPDQMRSRQAGFDHHFVKPVEFNTLRSVLTPGRWVAPAEVPVH